MRSLALLLTGTLWLAPLQLAAQADFKLNVNLVVLHVSVADSKGKPIPDLPQNAFQVYENGVEQNLSLFQREDAPVAVGLVVDNSGSMRRKLAEVVAAAGAFARSSNPDDHMFVVHFNEHVAMGLAPNEPFTSNPVDLRSAMLRIHARGETALYDAIAAALTHVRQSPLQKKVLIVVSDGGDNSSTLRFKDILKMIQESNVLVYTVGLADQYDDDRNPGVLKKLAKASGGEAFFPNKVSEASSVLEAVSRDIRNQYTVGYAPKDERKDGTYRAIRVKVTAPHSNHWTVRTRPGYFAVPPNSKAAK